MDQEPRSLITDEHRAAIGVPIEMPPVTITEDAARSACELFEETDPRYAPGTGIAPPYVLANLSEPVKIGLPAILPESLLTQQEARVNRHLRVGEVLYPVARLTDLRERLGGRFGHVVISLITTEYHDANGAVVASNTATVTQIDPGSLAQRDER